MDTVMRASSREAVTSDPGVRPVLTDALLQVLQQGTDLDAGRRLAGAQQDRYWLAALDMVEK